MHTNLPEILCCDVVEMIQTPNYMYFGYEILSNARILPTIWVLGDHTTNFTLQEFYRTGGWWEIRRILKNLPPVLFYHNLKKYICYGEVFMT